jgi:hypothetical protein
MGYPSGFMAEAQELNPILLHALWRRWLVASAVRTLEQLATVELGDGMDSEGTWMLGKDLGQYGLGHMARELGQTRQAEDAIVPFMPRAPAEGLAWAGLAALAVLVVVGLRQGRPAVWWPALFVLAVWLGNAALIALGGEVHGRYSARVIWLAPFLAGLVALRAAAGPPRRRPG